MAHTWHMVGDWALEAVIIIIILLLLALLPFSVYASISGTAAP